MAYPTLPCKIEDISLKSSRAIEVTGLIIAKTDAKIFESKSTITLTIRDDKHQFINCTAWGKENFIQAIDSIHKIGSVIRITRPIVSQHAENSKYVPQTSSPFTLVVNEGNFAYLYRDALENHPDLAELKHKSIKSTRLAVQLQDVFAMFAAGDKTQKIWCDVMAIVAAVDGKVDVQTKFGKRTLQKVTLFDRPNESIRLVIWSPEYAARVDDWRPMETILHLVDVRAEYSEFDRAVILTIDSRTIIVENPVQSSRALQLKGHLKELTQADHERLQATMTTNEPAIDLGQIKEVYTARRVQDLCEKENGSDFAALVYGTITKIDLEPGEGKGPIRRDCAVCKRFLRHNATQCDSDECAQKSMSMDKKFVERFDISVALTDFSGTINCTIDDDCAYRLFGYTCKEYKQLPEKTIDAIKKKYFFERFAVKLFVKFSRRSGGSCFIKVLDIAEEDPNDMAQNMKSY